MRASGSAVPALIGIDWGSSNLRAALLDAQGRLIDRRESRCGVFSVLGGKFAHVLWELCGDWFDAHRVPSIASGMIGSRQGILEVPYVQCPAHVRNLAQALGLVQLGFSRARATERQVDLYIVPGLRTGCADSGWDVMRGEETQLLGIDAAPDSVVVLPGTHSKWIALGNEGQVESFQTYMTGELFDLLTTHGSLARVMSTPQWSPEAFERGVSEARADSLENLLFRVRTAGLMERFPAFALADYLSGLLIGAELKAALCKMEKMFSGHEVSVLGTADLTQRYASALKSFGFNPRTMPGDAVFGGLMKIARSAGLLAIDANAVGHPERPANVKGNHE